MIIIVRFGIFFALVFVRKPILYLIGFHRVHYQRSTNEYGMRKETIVLHFCQYCVHKMFKIVIQIC